MQVLNAKENITVSLDLNLGQALRCLGNDFRFLSTRFEKLKGEL